MFSPGDLAGDVGEPLLSANEQRQLVVVRDRVAGLALQVAVFQQPLERTGRSASDFVDVGGFDAAARFRPGALLSVS